MSDPLDKATSKAPATLGEGCLSRYDPEDMSEEDGTEFPGAAQLWEQVTSDTRTSGLASHLSPSTPPDKD